MIQARRKVRKPKRIASNLFYLCLVIWPIVQFCIFYIGVNGRSLIMAFKYVDDDGIVSWGFKNFADLFNPNNSNHPNLSDVINGGIASIIAYALITGIGLPLGLFCSYYIGRKYPASGFFRVMLFLPSIIPEIVLVCVYKYFVINALPEYMTKLGWTGFGDWLSPNVATPAQQMFMVLFFTIGVAGFGTSVLLYSNAISKVSPEILDAAKVDGVGPWQEFWHIILPQIWPTVSVFIVTGVASIFINQIHLVSFFPRYDAPSAIQTYGYIIYRYSSRILTTGSINNQMANALSAFGLLLTCVAIPLTFLVRFIIHKVGPDKE